MPAPVITSRDTLTLPRVAGLDPFTTRLLQILRYQQQQLDALQGARSGTKLSGVLDANGQKITNLPDPTHPTDPVTLAYLEANALVKKNGMYTLNGGFDANHRRLEQVGDTRFQMDAITRAQVLKQITNILTPPGGNGVVRSFSGVFVAQTTFTVLGATHGLGTAVAGWFLWDTTAPPSEMAIGPETVVVNRTTGDVTFTFALATSARYFLLA